MLSGPRVSYKFFKSVIEPLPETGLIKIRSVRSGGIFKEDVRGEISFVKKDNAPVSLKRADETVIRIIAGKISKQVLKPSVAPFLKAFTRSFLENAQKSITAMIKRGKRSSEKF